VRDQLDIVEQAGYTPERFIWIHAQIDTDFDLNLEMARRGAWIEYDGIGYPEALDDTFYVARIRRMLGAGLGDRVLLSQDRGWYDPALPGGGTAKPFTYLVDTFLPRLREAGVDEDTILQLTHANPFRAFAR
jgi:phosphotriesterase-related protein